MAMAKDLEETFGQALELSDWFEANLHEGAQLTPGRKPMVALALTALALEHRAGLLLLVANGAIATAMAVTRPVLKAYVRALWAHELATEGQLAEFLKGRGDPSTEATMQKLWKRIRPHDAWLETLRRHYSTLSDYSHGGARQISRWLHRGAVESRYSDVQMIEVVRFADMVCLMSAYLRGR